MCLRIGKAERCPPRSAPDEPSVDIKGGSKLFHVCNQVLCGVRREVDLGRTCIRSAPTAIPLIELHDHVLVRIEHATVA
jgi:hypothetical protein